MTLKRISRLYIILGKNFNTWLSPVFPAIFIFFLRLFVGIGRFLDQIFYKSLKAPLTDPVIIVGNPRSAPFPPSFNKTKHRKWISIMANDLSFYLHPKTGKPLLPILEKLVR